MTALGNALKSLAWKTLHLPWFSKVTTAKYTEVVKPLRNRLLGSQISFLRKYVSSPSLLAFEFTLFVFLLVMLERNKL